MGSLYENIVWTCKERGVTPSKMCSDIGISRSLVYDLGKGRKKSLNADTLGKIANYLNVSPAMLMGMDYYNEETGNEGGLDEYRQMLVDRPEMKMLFDTAKGATKEQVEAIVNMLDAMRGNK